MRYGRRVSRWSTNLWCGGTWFIGFLNEKMGEGSILPGWLVHAVSNVGIYVAAVI